MSWGDGRPSVEAGPIYPNRYHPLSPVTGPALGDALRIAYCAARNRGRVVLTQNYPASYNGWASSLPIVAPTSMQRIAEGMTFIPRDITHLVAEIDFRVWTPGVDVSAFHRIEVSDGTHTDTGSEDEIACPDDSTSDEQRRLAAFFHRRTFFPLDVNVYRARCVVGLDTVSAAAVQEVAVSSYAVDNRTGGGIVIMPLLVRVWTEMR